MPSTLPDGDPVPVDGALPATALERAGERGFGIYVHVPFCGSRCGYCDFNTYTERELGGADRDGYLAAVLGEIELARRVLGGALPAPTSVFVGGGTPTLLEPATLARILEAVDRAFTLDAGAEITTEANPESVDPVSLKALHQAGFTRISLGMQSTAPHVLALLDRRHTPGRAGQAAQEARDAGFDHVNLDLIYATPGERAEDFDASLDAAVAAGVDHVSAYSLIVEDGTRLAGRVRRGEVDPPDDDVAARRYRAAEARLGAAGLSWYEISNWAAGPDSVCRHNLLYWRGGDWWGVGPGAHSHVGGVRWWNVKHPNAYAGRLGQGHSPGYAREVLGADERRTEEVMLGLRLADGLPLTGLPEAEVGRAVADGLLDPEAFARGRAILTLDGRLLADALTLRLLPTTPSSARS